MTDVVMNIIVTGAAVQRTANALADVTQSGDLMVSLPAYTLTTLSSSLCRAMHQVHAQKHCCWAVMHAYAGIWPGFVAAELSSFIAYTCIIV